MLHTLRGRVFRLRCGFFYFWSRARPETVNDLLSGLFRAPEIRLAPVLHRGMAYEEVVKKTDRPLPLLVSRRPVWYIV